MKKNVMKLLLVLAACFTLVLGATAVFADSSLDLVGNGTTTTASGKTPTSTKATTTTGTTTAGDPSRTTTTTGTTTRAQSVKTSGSYMEAAVPFLFVLAGGLALMLAFSHLKLNQVRYGKDEKYANEMKDFRKACE